MADTQQQQAKVASTSSGSEMQEPKDTANQAAAETSQPKPPDINPRGNNDKPSTISNKNISLQQDNFPAINESIMKECEECHQDFLRSYLYKNFSVFVCDECRDPKGVHELITRTDAKCKYLLKDCDLDLRNPPLRYILKKNPYQSRGDMRLYLKYQIEERALEVHGSEDKLEEELERREERRTIKKQKVYDKKMKSLSMQVRSSLYKRETSGHEHEFGEATCVDEDNDIYQKTCKTCGYKWEYEEM